MYARVCVDVNFLEWQSISAFVVPFHSTRHSTTSPFSLVDFMVILNTSETYLTCNNPSIKLLCAALEGEGPARGCSAS